MIIKKLNSEIKDFMNIFKKDNNDPAYFDWILLLSFFIIFFISYIYMDILETVRMGINVWKSIENGQLFNYYSFNYNVPLAPPLDNKQVSPGYGFSLYILFAVWNFPLWILERFLHINVFSNILCLLYMKLMLLFFLFGSAIILRKICKQLGISGNREKWAVFLFLSSGFVMSSLFIMTQYDIIMIFFLLIGIYMYLKDNMKYFTLFFSLAISFKMFAFLVFIPLLLLKKKNILSLILYFLASISITILFKIPFIFDNGIKGSLSFLIMRMLTSNVFTIGVSAIYLYPAALLALCIFCYIKNIESQEENSKYAIYISFLSFSSFFILTPAYPYWFIMLTPFLPLILLQNEKYFQINLILDTAASGSMIILQQLVYGWCYDLDVIEPMLLTKIFGSIEMMKRPIHTYSPYTRFFELFGIDPKPLMMAIFTVCLVYILILNFPKKSTVSMYKEITPSLCLLTRFRLLINGGICLLPIMVYILSIIIYGSY
jgi:hypothetical protein